MWKRLFRKTKQKTEPQMLEEVVLAIQARYEEKRKDMGYRHDAILRELRHHYEEKLDEARMHEKELTFERLLHDAEKEVHPFEYIIESGSQYYKKITFLRSKQSPNPFRIIVEVHKNCIFLGVTMREEAQLSEHVIRLYYDKVKKVYQEYEWKMPYDYATKHHIRMFLYDMMKHVKEDTLHLFPHYKNEFRARDEFWARDHVWKDAYEEQARVLEAKRDKEFAELEQLYEREIAPYVMEITEMKKQHVKIEQEKREQKQKEMLERLEESAKKEEQKRQILSGRVFDEEIDQQMKKVYQYAQKLLEKEVLLNIEQAHALRRLYEKDLQELWRSFIQLEEKKQQQEKKRFQAMLEGLEAHLHEFEEKMKQTKTFDYEKKMNYMERKYLS